ncbi:hypothetical protein POTOM_005446 [Populus tomentosa]|uniref:Uncharacterized protein n=1 Tax=Populus tomentosa TaxID=118781 RepID=A0A8X8DE51_POPTO|nr:hypothetical protein POTOM_005446 [Populus tomentosa]
MATKRRPHKLQVLQRLSLTLTKTNTKIQTGFQPRFSSHDRLWLASSTMELYDGNVFRRPAQAQAIPVTDTKAWKPLTRLQKQAPEALRLDQLSITASTNHSLPASHTSPPLTPIPLLSPLSVSPPPLPSEAEEFTFPVICGDIDKGREADIGDAYSEARVWHHPAVAGGYTEPSSLFAFFRSKCLSSSLVSTSQLHFFRIEIPRISFLFSPLYEKDELKALPDDLVDLNTVVLLSRFWQKDGSNRE